MDPSSPPDYQKSLQVLKNDWQDCTECELGQRRDASGGNFVFGEGYPRGIMFIGKGPSREDDRGGRVALSKSGQMLRHVIAKLNIERYYITNIVSCRSCAQKHDTEGNPSYRYQNGLAVPIILDGPPTPKQAEACSQRLNEEIYLVDPHIIVALGGEAAKALSRKAVTISQDSGTTMTITIPGAGYRPVLTEKRKAWARKVRGQLVTPVAQNEVEYLMMPIIDPGFALRNQSDARWNNPVQMFVEGMKKAAQIYYRYMLDVHGDKPTIGIITEDDVLEAMQE